MSDGGSRDVGFSMLCREGQRLSMKVLSMIVLQEKEAIVSRLVNISWRIYTGSVPPVPKELEG